LVDGKIVRPQSVEAGRHRFAVPPGAHEVTIASRSVVPIETEGGSLDPRRLGVPVEQIAVCGGGLRIEIGPGCPALSNGFHHDEGSHRWTDGAGKLPAALLAHFGKAVTVEVRIGATELHYPIEEPAAAPACGRPAAPRLLAIA
jgi:hypothetical protein